MRSGKTGKKLAGIFLIFCALCGCSGQKEVREEYFAMDTVITLTAYGKSAEQAVKQAKQAIDNTEQQMSRTLKDSDLSRLNQAGQLEKSQLSSDFLELYHEAYDMAQQTNGTFDMTLGALSDVWGVGTDHPSIPQEAQLQTAMEHCGWEKIEETETQIDLHGVSLDFGGIAKGWASDRAAEAVKEAGCDSALLYLGGNVWAVGDHQGEPWKIGIADPKDTGKLVGYLTVTDCAVVTSGDYQRYFEQSGKRYHHILDRSTGYPAESGLSSVTVISSSGTQADALSTACFVSGLEDGMELVQQWDAQAVFVTDTGEVVCTPGAEKIFVPS
ncbi:MAG: FAD:protein FMN transferase [Massiliimalia sp.]|jgi:thiamine biosynthesis lipoprotein